MYVAILRILKWMSCACDDNAIFLTREIPRLDHCICHNWTTDPHKGMQQYMCVITPIQFINYHKEILDKGAIIIMQIKEIAKWSNRGNL